MSYSRFHCKDRRGGGGGVTRKLDPIQHQTCSIILLLCQILFPRRKVKFPERERERERDVGGVVF